MIHTFRVISCFEIIWDVTFILAVITVLYLEEWILELLVNVLAKVLQIITLNLNV